MPTFSCSAILFDLDGVLVDSTRSVDREWRAWARRKGVDGDAIMAIAHGVRTVEVIRRVAPQLDAEAEARKIEKHEAHDKEGVSVMAGAAELLRSIPDNRWGVVTSGTRPLATARLRFCGLPVPKVLVTADDVANGKPHPEPYLKGAERLGFEPGGMPRDRGRACGDSVSSGRRDEGDWDCEHLCGGCVGRSRRCDREAWADSSFVERGGEVGGRGSVARLVVTARSLLE